MMTRFLLQLFDHGRVAVPEPGNFGDADTTGLETVLRELSAAYRLELPAGLPDLDVGSAIHGARTFYRACQLLAYRNFTADDIGTAITIGPPSPNPAEHLSVDLVLRFLPDAVRLARAAAPDDPLVRRLLELGRCWPLSSVGVSNLEQLDITALLSDRAVFRVYIDRVIARRDAARMADERVRAAIAESAGAYPELTASVTSAVMKSIDIDG